MEADGVEELQERLRRLGNLHDARVNAIERSSNSLDIIFHFDDIHGNFQELGSSPGVVPGRMMASGVKHVAGLLAVPEDAAGIWEITVNRERTGVILNVRFWPGGEIHVECDSVSLEESVRHEPRS